MSAFKVSLTARNPKREELETPPVDALVDTGSELTWLPAELLRGIGITPRRKRAFATATQQRVERGVGYAILGAEGYQTIDEVVFALPGDMTLLGENSGIDSVGVLRLVMALEKEFDIVIGDVDITPANLQTLSALVDLIGRKRAGSDT